VVSCSRAPSLRPALLVAAALLALPATPQAESALRLPHPPRFGTVPAATFDEDGQRVGTARIQIEALPDGLVSLLSESGIEDGASTRMVSRLEPAGPGSVLRPVHEQSQSTLADGSTLGLMEIDHAERVLRCVPPTPGEEPLETDLPRPDRVVLASMNLLFLPLVRGEVEEVEFQVAMCRGGPRLVPAVARRGPPGARTPDGDPLVEIRYELDFGPLLSAVVRPFLPRFSAWFDGAGTGDWLGHRMPLFSKGPTVMVVRTGVSPALLSSEP